MGIAEQLGFRGFMGKSVIDVGARDGRNVPLLRELGSREVIGIEPNTADLQFALDRGVLTRRTAIPKTLEELSGSRFRKRKFDVAAVFQFTPGIPNKYYFLLHLRHVLKDNGQVVLTFSENETFQQVYPLLTRIFKNIQSYGYPGKDNYPNKLLVIGNAGQRAEDISIGFRKKVSASYRLKVWFRRYILRMY